jgi:hypothetical protein
MSFHMRKESSMGDIGPIVAAIIEKATHVQSAPNGDISLVFEQPGRNASTSAPLENIIREVAMALRQAEGEGS